MLRSPLFKRNLVGIYILINRDFGSENCVCRVEMGTISSRFLLWKISLGNSSAINFIRLTLHWFLPQSTTIFVQILADFAECPRSAKFSTRRKKVPWNETPHKLPPLVQLKKNISGRRQGAAEYEYKNSPHRFSYFFCYVNLENQTLSRTNLMRVYLRYWPISGVHLINCFIFSYWYFCLVHLLLFLFFFCCCCPFSRFILLSILLSDS